ncbi:MAG: carbon-nitrogen hydrolase family protein [Crenarchaeota archaeon]|nr:carbon-nitrogen hydrolase family protein [Thermoproteota archaeon]
MIVGICQLSSCSCKNDNVRKLSTILEKYLQKVDLVIVPEYFMFFDKKMFNNPQLVYEISEGLDGDFVKSMSRLCIDFNINILFTMFLRSGSRVYNSAILMSRDGSILTIYRKIHLFDAYGFSESHIFSRGFSPCKVVELCGFKIGIAICFDIRFPELFRHYALSGADVVLVPAAWFRGDYKEEILRFLAQARAHENCMYVIVCDQYSDIFVGRSMIVDPNGIVALDLGYGESYREYRLDRFLVELARERVPVLRLRRPLTYTRILM